MGLETAARINVHKKVHKPKQRVLEIFPQEAMAPPSAPVRGIPEEGEEERCGNTLTAAPVSTKYLTSVFVSCR